MNIVHSGVGAISHSDLDLAQACGACIVGFNVKGGSSVNLSAAQASVKVPRSVPKNRFIYSFDNFKCQVLRLLSHCYLGDSF